MPETRDLLLKQGCPEDGPALHRNLWSRPEVFRYLFRKALTDEAAGLARTAAYTVLQQEAKTEFFVYEKASAQAIGIAGIKQLTPDRWTVTDIAIGPDFQGKGYGKQILQALIDLAFEGCGAAELLYDCFVENIPSKKLALSCGFVYDHTEEAELPKDGKPVMLEYYKLPHP